MVTSGVNAPNSSWMKKAILVRIREAATQGLLAIVPHLGIILSSWRRRVGVKEPRAYVEDLVRTDEGLLDFLFGPVTVGSRVGLFRV